VGLPDGVADGVEDGLGDGVTLGLGRGVGLCDGGLVFVFKFRFSGGMDTFEFGGGALKLKFGSNPTFEFRFTF
jgi:hypothetical protein